MGSLGPVSNYSSHLSRKRFSSESEMLMESPEGLKGVTCDPQTRLTCSAPGPGSCRWDW